MSKNHRTQVAQLLILLVGLILTVNANADCFPNPSGLIGWWPGDGNANNLLGTNNGTLQGGTTASAAGLVGNAFTFDGTNNFVQIPNSPILQPTNLTIEAWIKFTGLDSAGTGPAAGVQNIIFKQNTQSSTFEGFDLGKTRVSGSDYFRFIVSSGSGQTATIRSSTAISTGVWYHVAAVRGPNFTQLYVNGVLERQTNVAFAQNYGTQPLYFGTTGQSYWDRRFKGNLDEVSLYNRALGSNEITAIFTTGVAGKCKAPNITTQPQHATVILGGSTNFAVTATGLGTLRYQWRLNGTNILGATNATLVLFNLQATNAGNYSVVVTNTSGSATSANAVLTVGTPAVLWNVDFGATTTDKSGPAAAGQSTNDFWNAYPYAGGFHAEGGVVLLQTANTNPTQVGINVPGAPGSWGNGSLDPMYQGYVYPTLNPSAATITITISSLPPGDYDFCLYSSECNFQLVSGATDYGIKTGQDLPFTNPPLWEEGKQYVQFRNIAVTNIAQPVIITVNPGPSGYAIISGLQIVRYAPLLLTQPTNAVVAVGNPITLQTLGEAAAPVNYQWFFNGNPLANAGRVSGATNHTLVITNAQLADAGNYFAVVSGSSGAITTQVAVVQVGLPPIFTQSPAPQTNLIGSTVQFSGLAPEAAPLSFQWYFNGNPVANGGRYSGATTTNLTIVSLLLGDAGAYSLVATNPFGSATSSIANLTVLLPPAITTPPQSQSTAFGSNISFQVVATGSAPLSYQWFFNSTPLADDARHNGATTTQLSISNLQISDAGDYTVVVGNLAGSITSVVATLTLGTPPTITQQPLPQTVLIGAPAQFNVTATSDTPFSYQWYRNGATVSGATSNSLTFNPAQPFQAGDYTVIVSNAFSAITSSTAAFTVISNPMTLLNMDFGDAITTKIGPAVIGQSSNDFWSGYAGAGGFHTDGTLALFKLANGEFSPVGLRLPNAPGSWGNGSSDSMYASYVYPTTTPSATTMTVTVTNLPVGIYDFYLYANDGKFQLVSATVDYGIKTSLENPVVNPPVWQEGKQYVAFQHVAVTNATQPVIITVQPGIYGYAIISGIQIAQFVTNDVAPAFWVQPTDQYVGVGTNIIVRATGVGSPAPTYRWFRNGTALNDDARITGSASSTLTITGAQLSDNGNFFVVLSNSVGSVTSSVVVVQAVENPQLPSIVQSPVSQTNIVGGVAQFNGLGAGTEPLSYRWYQNTTALSDDARRSGTTTTNLTIANLVVGDAGNYTLRVTNPFGIATSAVATLTIPTPPSITTQPRGFSVPVGMPVTLSASATGTAPLRYQWVLNSNPVPNATNFSLTISNLLASDFGNYQLVVTNFGGAITSAIAPLTVGNIATWGSLSQAASFPLWPSNGLGNVVAVAAGSSFNLALRQEGTVHLWGGNNQVTNIPPGLSGVVGIAAGQNHALALLSNGTVRAWGLGTSGQTNVPTTLSNVIAVAAGSAHSAALRVDGTVVVWGGSSTEAQTNIPPGLMKVTSIDAGGSQTLALREDGSLIAWGGRTQYPVPPDVKNVAGFSVGPAFSALDLAVTSNGLVRAWGGSGSATNVPATISGISAVEGAGGNDQTTGIALAVRSNRTVVGWGGNIGSVSSLTNVPPGVSNVITLSGGLSHVLALVDNGTPLIIRPPVGGTFYTGRDLALKAKAAGTAPLAFQWFKNGNPIPGATDESLVVTFALTNDAGSYHLVVSNALGVAQSVAVPVTIVDRAPVLMSQVQSRYAYYGSPFSVGASVIGSGPIDFQWLQNGVSVANGTNDLVFERALPQHDGNYQLIVSNPFGAVTSSVAQIKFTRIAAWGTGISLSNAPFNLGDITAVAANSFTHGAVLKPDGTVATWGNSTIASNVPPGVSNVVAISTGIYYTLGLCNDGTVLGWHFNAPGGAPAAVVPANLSDVAAISAGANHALALRSNGTVVAWGLNTSFQTNTPVGLSNVVAISAGFQHSLALKSDGTLVGWGLAGKFPNYTNIVAIAAGYSISLALQADGTVLAWTSTGGISPLPAGLSNIVAISSVAGSSGNYGNNSVALRSDGTCVAWGNNLSSQLTVLPELTSGIYPRCGAGFTLVMLNDRSPVVATQPLNRHAASGTNVTLAALAVGQPALNFQWRVNGNDIPGATSSILTLTNVTRNSRGYYSALVGNSLGSTNSREAWLDVVGPVRLLTTTGGRTDAQSFVATDSLGGALTAEDLAWLEVQASTNLVNWQIVSNALVFTNGTLLLQDLTQTNHPTRFYRLIEH